MESELITYWAFIKWFVFDYKFSILFLVLYPYFYYTVSTVNYKKNKIKRDNETIGRIVFTICGRTIVIINIPFIVLFPLFLVIGTLINFFLDGGSDWSIIDLTMVMLSGFFSFHNEAGGFFYSFGRFINHIDIGIFYCLFMSVLAVKKEVKKTENEEKRLKREIAKEAKIKAAKAKEVKIKAVKAKEAAIKAAEIAREAKIKAVKANAARRDALKAKEATIKAAKAKQKKSLIDKLKTRVRFDKSHEVIKSFKSNIICLDMPMEMVDFLKGKKFNQKRSVSKTGTTERYNYEPYKSSRGNTKYKLEVDFQDGLVIKFQDL